MSPAELLPSPSERLLLEPPGRGHVRRTNKKLLDQYARRINAAHVACVQEECAALRHAIRAGKLLSEVKAKVGHGQWLPWLRRHCQFPYDTALVYMEVSAWYLANPERAQYLKSIRQVLEQRRQDRAAPRHIARLRMNDKEWGAFWGLLGELGAKYDPVPMILQALGALANQTTDSGGPV